MPLGLGLDRDGLRQTQTHTCLFHLNFMPFGLGLDRDGLRQAKTHTAPEQFYGVSSVHPDTTQITYSPSPSRPSPRSKSNLTNPGSIHMHFSHHHYTSLHTTTTTTTTPPTHAPGHAPTHAWPSLPVTKIPF